MMADKTEDKILEVYDNQERYWLEATVRLMKRVTEYAELIKAAIDRNDTAVAKEHLEMLKSMATDEKEQGEQQLKNSKEN